MIAGLGDHDAVAIMDFKAALRHPRL